MRFKPITTYARSWGEYAIQEHIDNLVRDFGVKSWCQCHGQALSMVERVLIDGNAIPRNGSAWAYNGVQEFGKFNYPAIDHAAFIKCVDGKTFVLTMPYADKDFFHKWFNELIAEYQARKLEIRNDIEDGYGSDYKSKTWIKQIYADTEIRAVIVDNKYKIRKNGDIVAIIATAETLEAMGLR